MSKLTFQFLLLCTSVFLINDLCFIVLTVDVKNQSYQTSNVKFLKIAYVYDGKTACYYVEMKL